MKTTMTLLTFLLLAPQAALQAADTPAAAVPRWSSWPLRNGDFSRDEFFAHYGPSWADWRIVSQVGRHTVRRLPLHRGLFAPAVLVIHTEEAGRGVVYQDVLLPPGEYAFRAEVKVTPGALLAVALANGRSSCSSTEWAESTTSFSVSELGPVRVHLISVSVGEVQIRNARIDVRRLQSAPVPLDDGRRLGGIVLPQKPTMAERYAAWELQQFIRRMTGLTPGLADRDSTADGLRIRIGQAAGPEALSQLKSLASDSYLVAARGDEILLAGNNDRGTLYAAYDFLKQQGCGWYLPGSPGEVVPNRKSLRTPQGQRIESPDWDVRGFMKHMPDWDSDDAWRMWNADDYFDWCMRNRLNAYWCDYALTADFGPWRGGSHIIRTNHSWSGFWLEGNRAIKPEWAPLVAGRRKPMHVSGRCNLPCTSNATLREHTVQGILKFFRENPQAIVFGLNADDEPAEWCECPQCRAQDADRGTGAWRTSAEGAPLLAMTDRSLNYVNEVADRVAKVYPGRLIEMYAYGSNRRPPEREKVHPNVLIKYALWPGSVPFGMSARDRSLPSVAAVGRFLDGWKQAGAQHFGLYDYGNYRYPDTVQLWLRHICDSLATLHDVWGFRHYLAENSNTFAPSHMAYNVRARALWNRNTDCLAAVREVCDGFYGPAAQAMYDYYAGMDEAYVDYWRKNADRFRVASPPPYAALELQEFSFETMAKGQEQLDAAWKAVAGDSALRARIAPVRLGHALSTYTMAMTAEATHRPLTRRDVDQARKAWELARALRREYNVMLAMTTTGHLKAFRVAPPAEDIVFEMPILWRFKKDPGNRGLADRWYQAAVDGSWTGIRTDASWVEQGHPYHGVAWYTVEFNLSEAARAALDKIAKATPALGFEKPRPALLFGAVDGDADIFLDGIKIGEQKEPVDIMWDQPFSIALPKDFAADKPHRLVVRVKKDIEAAGIWRPVRIVKTGP